MKNKILLCAAIVSLSSLFTEARRNSDRGKWAQGVEDHSCLHVISYLNKEALEKKKDLAMFLKKLEVELAVEEDGVTVLWDIILLYLD